MDAYSGVVMILLWEREVLVLVGRQVLRHFLPVAREIFCRLLAELEYQIA
jgi:hypothetical protein